MKYCKAILIIRKAETAASYRAARWATPCIAYLNLLRLGHSFEYFSWRAHGQCRMLAARVVQLDPGFDGAGGALNALEMMAANA